MNSTKISYLFSVIARSEPRAKAAFPFRILEHGKMTFHGKSLTQIHHSFYKGFQHG